MAEGSLTAVEFDVQMVAPVTDRGERIVLDQTVRSQVV